MKRKKTCYLSSSSALEMNSSILWVVKRLKVVSYRRFDAAWPFWPLNMGPMCSPETSVWNQLTQQKKWENGGLQENHVWNIHKVKPEKSKMTCIITGDRHRYFAFYSKTWKRKKFEKPKFDVCQYKFFSKNLQPSFLRLFDGNLREHRGVFTRPQKLNTQFKTLFTALNFIRLASTHDGITPSINTHTHTHTPPFRYLLSASPRGHTQTPTSFHLWGFAFPVPKSPKLLI
jgi:hypothetical protein